VGLSVDLTVDLARGTLDRGLLTLLPLLLPFLDSRASSREMASLSWRATPCSRDTSLRGLGCEICSIWEVIESSR
jgi:hypothetical protein